MGNFHGAQFLHIVDLFYLAGLIFAEAQFLQMVDLFYLAGLIFAEAHTHAHYVLYN